MGEWDSELFHRALSSEPTFRVTASMLQNAGIGKSYWSSSMDQIPDSCSHKKVLMSMIKSLHLDERMGKGAIFFGNHGHGKTSSSSIMLKAALARGGQVFHRKASTLEYAYEKRWMVKNQDGIPVWDMLIGSQFLTLDDLGSELRPSGYRAGDIVIVEELIRERYDSRLVTYITTNLPMQELPKYYGSICSIFFDPSRFSLVEVCGFNWRRGRVHESE